MSSVCVVDDEPAMQRLLQRAMLGGGYTVDLVDRGGAALGRVLREHYDLVLLDLMLPDLDGVTVLQALRAAQPQLPVMVISAADDAANRVRCLDLGACDFVGKPFDVTELLARVRSRLRPWPTTPEHHVLRAGQLELDLRRHEVRTPERRITLAPREFMLLHHLAEHYGDVCTREELLQSVWGYQDETDSNVIDVYVSRLRAKLPADYIETVRSVGYCLLAP